MDWQLRNSCTGHSQIEIVSAQMGQANNGDQPSQCTLAQMYTVACIQVYMHTQTNVNAHIQKGRDRGRKKERQEDTQRER